ncbi:TetR/AcrR family transcriptional regulator [Hazenella coriacea]|uniref:TetR family transcriptional regulator n=1 Tax=Hazenella coriacea TaxID=1179467 RepID=A0A4R3L6F1_9BACL|nr:TetR/AcrR family transcriptional regulator [Hazenella coriacea]TCS95451.1 TetR family transcriptional regulator [Hazenella coriacea]
MRHEKVDVIFQAAIEVFADSGFDQAKMDDIAQEAKVAKGTIYYHFKSKEELFVGLMNEGMEKLIEYVTRNMEIKSSPTERLEALLMTHIQFFMDNGKLAKLLLNEAFGRKERQSQFRAKIREYLRLIEDVLEEGKNEGVFDLQFPQETASAIFGAASVVVLQKLYSVEEVDVEIEHEAPKMMESINHLIFGSILTK